MNRQTRRKDNKDERGSALVLTLGILSLVLIMGMSFAFSSRTSRQVAKVNADQVKANLHGESGLDYALGVMQEWFVETDGGETYHVLYPPTYKRPNTATDLEKRFVFSEHNMGFKVESDQWAHQHIWSYVPADDDKVDNSTDEEYSDVDDDEPNGFDVNKKKHSFYYTLMNEVPQLRLQTLQHISTTSDSDKSSYDDAGTKDSVQAYLKKIGFHTITSDDEIVGRVGFLVLEEGHKFDVNQMLTLKTETATSKVNIPFVEHGDDVERCADLYTTDWSEKDYYYNITGKFDPKVKIVEEEKDTTVRWGLHVQELYAGDPSFYDNLLDGAKHGTVTSSIRWMSYDHLWKGLNNTSALPSDISGIYTNNNNYFYKNSNFAKLTFFSAEEPEAWWYDKEGIEVARFDVTGYEWRDAAASATPPDYYKEDASGKMRPHAKTEGETVSTNGWDDISDNADKDKSIRDLAFVDNNGAKLTMDDTNLSVFIRKSDDDDYEAARSIPALAGMKDKDGNSVALQVAANMVDYCDGNDYASVSPTDARSTLTSTSSLPDDFKIVYCGNERVAYFNELALQFHASRAYNDESNNFIYRLRLMPQLEMANMFGKDETIPVGNIVVRIKGTYGIACSKDGDEHGSAVNSGTGHDEDHAVNPTTDKDFEMIFKANNEGASWSEGYKSGFEFEMLTGNNLVFEYKEGYAGDPLIEEGLNGEQIITYLPPKVDYTVKITSVAMISWDDGEGADEKVYDIAWWKKESEGESNDSFEMKYTFDNDTNNDIDRYYYGTLEANDPRCNHRSVAWAWKKDGDETFGGFVSNPSSNSDFDGSGYHTLGDANSDFTPADSSKIYGAEKEMDKEKADTKIYQISTAFIRNAPFETLWELGAIHRGEPFRTINLSIFSDDFEEDDFDGKYLDGDAHILDQVKIGPARYSRGKFNVNSRSTASYSMLYDDDWFGKDDTYDNPSKQGANLPEPEWDFKDAETHFSRGQIADLMVIDYDDTEYENDRQMESFIGRTANLLTTRNEAYTVIVISQALQERKELQASLPNSMSKKDQLKIIKVSMANPTWHKIFDNDHPSGEEHLCEILGTNVIMAHVVRDGWTGKMTVVKKEYLNSSK